MNTLFILLLVLLAGLSNGVMDTLQFHYSKSIFRKDSLFWNPAMSWKNKYKTSGGELLKPLTPKFPGSTTFLVWTTDGWHLFQMIMFACLRTALVLLATIRYDFSTLIWIGIWFGLYAIQQLGFWIMYNHLLVKKE